MEYMLSDGQSEQAIEAESLEEAKKEAIGWVAEGDWGDDLETMFVTVGISADGERLDSIVVSIEPDEPRCTADDGHDWRTPHEIVGGLEENPGCWGHGGGVICSVVCMNCAARRQTDTWAQNPVTGEQGLTSVRYDAEHYSEALRRYVEGADATSSKGGEDHD